MKKIIVLISATIVAIFVATVLVVTISDISFSGEIRGDDALLLYPDKLATESSVLEKTNLESTSEKLAASLANSLEDMCNDIYSIEHTDFCASVNLVFVEVTLGLPTLDFDNRFDVQRCEQVDLLLSSLDELLYEDHYLDDDLFNLPDEELQEKVSRSILDKHQLDMAQYDTVYAFVGSAYESLMFWNFVYGQSCHP